MSKTSFGPKDDRFELKKQLDKGSQGTVFICTRVKTGAELAVKRIDVGSLQLRRNAGKVRKNLTREIRIMRLLHHEHVVNLIEAFWDGDVCFVVMDLARGGTVHDKLVPGVGLGNEDSSINLTRQLLDGMGYMHREGVIHRDLKPANLLITHEDEERRGFYFLKIADFGLSRVINEPGGEQKGMTKVGTPAFAAPEIFADTYDELADFWSLGCILFTMLCGEYPFSDMPDHIKNPSSGKTTVLPCPSWTKVSENVKDLCLGLLNPMPRKRLDLHGCLRHPCLVELAAQDSSREMAPQVTHRRSSKGRAPPPLEEDSGSESSCYQCFYGPLVAMRLIDPARAPFLDAGRARANTIYQPSSVLAGVGVVSSIRGWVGSSVDSIQIKYTDGRKPHIFGGDGGTDFKDWRLYPDELIIAVTQERQGDGFLGYSFVFFTSAGRSITVKGSLAASKRRFVAPAGTQVVGLMFEESELVGLMIEKSKQSVTPCKMSGLIEKISGSVGHAVDCVKFCLRDGEERIYGNEDNGDEQKSMDLAKNESIVIVEQGWKDAYLGYSVSFYTTAGNVFSLRGISATQSLRFMTSNDEQICGMEFTDDGRLRHVQTCGRDGDMSQPTRHPIRAERDIIADGESASASASFRGSAEPSSP